MSSNFPKMETTLNKNRKKKTKELDHFKEKRKRKRKLEAMVLEKSLPMTAGDSECSYANNSILQVVFSIAKKRKKVF